jgi:cbb3-type cytochrome oxidase maturation protein
MSMLYVLIPLALMLLAVAVWALIWAIRSGQFDDLESHGWSVVLDDDQRPPPDSQRDQDAPLESGDARDEKPGTQERNTS